MSRNPASVARVAMVGPSLSGGGAERVLALLAGGLAGRGHRVAVVTIYGPELDFWRLPPSVERIALRLGGDTVGWWAKVAANVRRVRGLRDALRPLRPDLLISFMSRTNVLALLAARPLGLPVVATEHTDPRMEPLEPIWELLRRWTYRQAAQVVSVSAGVDAYFGWVAANRRCVIPNPVCVHPGPAPAGSEGSARPVVVGMGRLEREKGFDLLIDAFARVAPEFPDWSLAIVGQGSQRPALQQQAARQGLADRVCFPGAVSDPIEALRHADLFVLSSRYEGFGLALVEAMACGVPVVAFDCPSGPREILRHGVDGLLVPAQNVDRLAEAMAALMRDPARRRQLGQSAQQSAARFHIDRVVDAWQALLARLALF